jgi:hypothetical protein
MGAQQSQTLKPGSPGFMAKLPMSSTPDECEIKPPVEGHDVFVFPVYVCLDPNMQLHILVSEKTDKEEMVADMMHFKFSKSNIGDNSICKYVAFYINLFTGDDRKFDETKNTSLYRQFQNITNPDKINWNDRFKAIPNNIKTFMVQSVKELQEQIKNEQIRALTAYADTYKENVERIWNISKIASNVPLKQDSYAVVVLVNPDEYATIQRIGLWVKAGKIESDQLFAAKYTDEVKKSFVEHVHSLGNFTDGKAIYWAKVYKHVLEHDHELRAMNLEMIKSAMRGYQTHITNISAKLKADKTAMSLASAPVDESMSAFSINQLKVVAKDPTYMDKVAQTLRALRKGEVMGYKSNALNTLIGASVAGLGAVGLRELWKSKRGKDLRSSISSMWNPKSDFCRGEVIQAMPKLADAKTKLQAIIDDKKLKKDDKRHGKIHVGDLEKLESLSQIVTDAMKTLSSVLKETTPPESEDFDISDEEGSSDVFVA